MGFVNVRAVSQRPHQQFLILEAVTQSFLERRSEARRGRLVTVGYP